MKLAFLAGVIVALILAIFCEWVRAVETVRTWPGQSWAAGTGHCLHTGPISGQCICTRFHLDDQNPQECAYCSHAWSIHAVD